MTAPVREANRILDRLGAEARARAEAGLDRVDAGPHGLDLASNDYLGLANHPSVIAAGCEAIARWGTSARASRLVTGTTPAHHEAEAALSALTGRDTALVFSSGYAANLAVLTALTGPDCLIVSDAHNHASLIDACRLSKAEVVRTPHGDATAVEEALRQRTQPEAIVVVESVYSVLGDAPDLARLLELCARFDALLVIDEAHGIGVVGGGAGAAAALVDHRDRVVVTATLSKSLGAQGGAVLGPAAVRDEFVIVSRAGLGTLNHTALTCEALRARGLPIGGIVLGSWPTDPAPVAVDNRRRLGDSAPVLGAVPAGAGQLRPAAFRAAAGSWTSLA